MAKVQTFRDLIAWQRGMSLSKLIYQETRRMPRSEQMGLKLQIRRASVSIPSNIAEGFGRQSRPDLIRFLRNARGSLNEVSTQYQLAYELEMIAKAQAVIDLVEETDRVLQGLIRSLERKR